VGGGSSAGHARVVDLSGWLFWSCCPVPHA
jgi:hypothetical protein